MWGRGATRRTKKGEEEGPVRAPAVAHVPEQIDSQSAMNAAMTSVETTLRCHISGDSARIAPESHQGQRR